MDISIADFIIHVDESLPKEQLDNLQELVRQGQGVISANVSGKAPHLMLVTYNPDCTTSKEIMEAVKERGVHAESLGL